MTDPITKAERDELARLHAAATPGPWMGDWCIITEEGDVIARTDVSVASDPAVADNDGPLIVAARNALPRLLAALEAAEAERNNMVYINRLLRERPDLGDRASRVDALIAERDALKVKLQSAELDMIGVMLFVDKWLDDDDEAGLAEHPVIRSAKAREIALKWGEGLEAKLAALVEVMSQIAKPTYGSELTDTPEELASHYWSIISRLQWLAGKAIEAAKVQP